MSALQQLCIPSFVQPCAKSLQLQISVNRKAAFSVSFSAHQNSRPLLLQVLLIRRPCCCCTQKMIPAHIREEQALLSLSNAFLNLLLISVSQCAAVSNTLYNAQCQAWGYNKRTRFFFHQLLNCPRIRSTHQTWCRHMP